MDAIKNFLSGKLTYLTALSAILAAVIGWTQGAIDLSTAVAAILGAIATIGVRRGINTASRGKDNATPPAN